MKFSATLPKGGSRKFKSAADYDAEMARKREWYKKDYHKKRKRPTYRARVYGLNVAEVEALVAGQNRQCGACAAPLGDRFCIDHNHKTGKIRMAVCYRCNIGIGYVEHEDHEKWVAYIAQHNS